MDSDGLPPLADLVPAVDVEDARLAENRPGGGPRRVDESTRLDVLSHGDGDVLVNRWKRDHVFVRNRITRTVRKRLQVELERAP